MSGRLYQLTPASGGWRFTINGRFLFWSKYRWCAVRWARARMRQGVAA